MPNALTHYVFSKKLLKKLPAAVSEKIEGYEKYYFYASMGGDVLYGLNFSKDKTKRRYGWVVHEEKIKESFETAKDAQLAPEQLAFVLGMMSHYCLDSSLHPYIFYIQRYRLEQLVPKDWRENCHMLAETEIDRYFAEEFFGDKNQKTAGLFYWDKDVVNVTYDYYMRVQKDVFDFSLSLGDVKLANFAWKMFAKLGTKGGIVKKKVTEIIEKLIKSPHLFTAGYRRDTVPEGWDVLNLNRMPYIIVRGDKEIKKNETFLEQFDKALKMAEEYLTTFVTARKTGEELALDFSINYDGDPVEKKANS